MISSALKAKLQTLPLEPGCYLMKDKNDTIIYVGKAKKLKNRVNQYFVGAHNYNCLLYTSPSPRDRQKSRMPSSA